MGIESVSSLTPRATSGQPKEQRPGAMRRVARGGSQDVVANNAAPAACESLLTSRTWAHARLPALGLGRTTGSTSALRGGTAADDVGPSYARRGAQAQVRHGLLRRSQLEPEWLCMMLNNDLLALGSCTRSHLTTRYVTCESVSHRATVQRSLYDSAGTQSKQAWSPRLGVHLHELRCIAVTHLWVSKAWKYAAMRPTDVESVWAPSAFGSAS